MTAPFSSEPPPEARVFQVSAGVAPLRAAPLPDAEQISQALFGETLLVWDEGDGFARAECSADGVRGYVELDGLSFPALTPTHRVSALRTYFWSAPDLRSAPRFLLSMHAQATLIGIHGAFAEVARGGFIPIVHLRPIADVSADWVSEAEKFLHTPYQHGGKESLGLDAGALVHVAMAMAGRACPRFPEQQSQSIGELLSPNTPLRRGDLVFWPRHAGIMVDEQTVLHCDPDAACVVREVLSTVIARRGQPSTMRRP